MEEVNDREGSCDMIGSGSESGGIARNRPPTPQRKRSGVEGAARDGRRTPACKARAALDGENGGVG